ncbi:NADPH:quinone reductase [Palleronia marisminoris]|uniref:NADP-dependent oxidoreductase n=1 Tax=Palleronia marisminoris TaxID=315423 RepID=UPI0008EE9EDB|nr:NADP-dependent oxidoreductase [Palleronia marisminoris]SFH26748.1 NADPH:quinone reductase [Palleronia marisminoris]
MSLAVRIHEFGASDVLRSEDVPTPEHGPGEVRIRVHAASVNPVDYKIRQGGYPMVSADDLPITMGRDVAGVVDAVGDGAESFDEGALVHAMISNGGGYAQHAIVNVGDAAAVPNGLGHDQAAAIPLAGLTAWQALVDHGKLRGGQSVLIHGGAGGVGHLAVQIAKARGAQVFTTAAAEDASLLRELGADKVIDYRNQRFEDEIDEVDLVVDLVGGETQNRSWAVLKSGGAMVSTLEEPSEEKAREKNAHTARFLVQPNGTQLGEIGRLVLKGQLRPVVSEVLPLERAAEAQDKLEQEHVQGKIVLSVP